MFSQETGARTYGGDLVGGGVLDDSNQALKLLRGELTGPLVQVNIGLLADEVGFMVFIRHGKLRVLVEVATYSNDDRHP